MSSENTWEDFATEGAVKWLKWKDGEFVFMAKNKPPEKRVKKWVNDQPVECEEDDPEATPEWVVDVSVRDGSSVIDGKLTLSRTAKFAFQNFIRQVGPDAISRTWVKAKRTGYGKGIEYHFEALETQPF